MTTKKLHSVLIEKLVPGGFGLGRLQEGIVILTRYVLPGEKVLVREVSRKKDFITATLKEILTPSPDRIDPPCPIYGRCGGCDLQHANPETQIRLKKAILTESLQRTAGNIFADPARSIQSPLAADQQFGYRQRIRLQVDENGRFGFFRPESHILEPAKQCPLALEELNTVLKQLHSNDSFGELIKHCRAFELLFNPESSDTIMLLHFNRKPRANDNKLAGKLANETNGLSAILMQVEGYGLYDPETQIFTSSPPLLSQTLALDILQQELVLSWEAGGFCQVNLEQNKKLIQLVLEMVANGSHNRVLDLYCGFGNFSLPVAGLAGEIMGFDSQNRAIRSAKRNAERNGISNCYFEKNKVNIAVSSLLAEDRTFDAIILDPPRQGASDIASLLPGLNAEQIIYISCNPATLARDLALLIPAGYELYSLVPVDMFPQTHHLESVALLKRTAR